MSVRASALVQIKICWDNLPDSFKDEEGHANQDAVGDLLDLFIDYRFDKLKEFMGNDYPGDDKMNDIGWDYYID